MQDFHDDLARMQERIETRNVGSREYTIQAKDPFGFWYVKGTAADTLKEGCYTSADDAWKAIKAYEDKKALEESKVEKINEYVRTMDGSGKSKRVKKSDLYKDEEKAID